MREIKFRAWDKRTEQMFNNELFLKSGRELMKFVQRMRPYLPDMENAKGGLLLPTDDENMVFMQFTCLHDSDGTEIYEGDIIEIYCDCDPGDYAVCSHLPDIATVGWFQENASFELFDAEGRLYNFEFSADYEDVIKVIGNIYEHPHLLTKEDDERWIG